MSAKAIVKAFYESDLANDATIVSKFFHEDCELHWNSSKGFSILKYDDIETFFKGIRESFNMLRFQISHLIEQKEFVTSRHTLFVRTIENPDNETAMAHYISIWELKDGKLFRCHEISQLTDDKALKANSYSKIKI